MYKFSERIQNIVSHLNNKEIIISEEVNCDIEEKDQITGYNKL